MARRASSSTARSCAHLEGPSPLMAFRSACPACSSPDRPARPGSCSSSWASCSTPLPAMPVRSTMASSSISESAEGPRAASFSRGWAWAGRSLRAMVQPGGGRRRDTVARGVGAWMFFYNTGQFIGTSMTSSASSSALPTVQDRLVPHAALPPVRACRRCDQHLQRQARHAVPGRRASCRPPSSSACWAWPKARAPRSRCRPAKPSASATAT